ncbi:uncharacterized protein EDB91DRAFT_521697 [Suillus paluster]|uniref:uncharacterized protein n=1 Tax=Suillus paluster TaxID=48578 RepID=UPI001B870A8E|nr:uncharacterized protein EDB91DRAFT_521697 [Suillus paluster]KAG1752521.1 hypothetical protein EDB91DRAFT_521697 [Suillus paluster]
MSQSNSNSGSGAPSPEAQFHIPSMDRSDSPNNIDFNPNHNENDRILRTSLLQQHIDDNHHRNSESLFSHGGVQSMYNTSHNFHLIPEYLSDDISLKQSLAGSKSQNDFGAGSFRSSLSAYNGISGGNTSSTGATGSYRLRQSDGLPSQQFSNANEMFASHQPLQHQLSHQSQQGSSRSAAFESHTGFDFGANSPLGGSKVSQQFSSLDPFLQAHSSKGQHQSQVHDSYHPLSHSNSASQIPYLNGMHLQSQTPYGPHLQSNGGNAGASTNNARPMASAGQINLSLESQSVNNGLPEEISTIFVVGFPDDMQEREFQNMFTFSSGFEAATLKIPNKEYTAYGSVGGTTSTTPSGLPLRGGAYAGYLGAGSNDPYNVVTVNQGGVLIDNGRDGPTTSWPPLAMPLDEPSHFQVGQGLGGQPPRKQIIGFAKFRSRQEALEARDLLQGRRVDIEKGAILKAEMAKKNLHTKRGVGMGATTSGSGGSVSLGSGMGNIGGLSGSGGMGSLNGLASNADLIANLAGLGLNSNLNLNNLAALTGNNSDLLSARERELNAVGLGGSGWREGRLGDSSEDERESNVRDRRREALGLGLGLMRGARERAQADEEDRVRRSKDLKQFQTDAPRMLPGNTAFDAFHAVSAPSRHSQSGLLSPAGGSMSLSGLTEGGSNGPSPLMGNGYGNIIAQTGRDATSNMAPDHNNHRESRSIGPWDPPSSREREGSGIPQTLSSLYAARKSMIPVRPPSPQQESPPSNPAFSPTDDDDMMLPPHRSGAFRSLYPLSSQVDKSLHLQTQPQSMLPGSATSSSVGGFEGDRPVLLAVSTSAQPSSGSAGIGSPQLPSPAASQSGSASSSAGMNGGGSATSAGNVAGAGPRNVVVDQNPPINTLYVGNLPTGSVGSGYPAGFLEDSLRELFSRRPGYRKLCFRQKSNGPMCFVEFDDVHYATKALNELYGNTLGGIVKNGGIRLSYSKNPLGVRTPTSAGTGTSLLQQQQGNTHSGVASPFPSESYQARHPFDVDTSLGMRRESSTATSLSGAYGYSRSPPPPRFFSPPPSSTNFSMAPTASTGSAAAFPRGSQAFGLPSPNGAPSTFSPFGLPLSSPRSRANGLPPSHSLIPDQSSEGYLTHDHPQHFPHRALSPSTTLEAARAG